MSCSEVEQKYKAFNSNFRYTPFLSSDADCSAARKLITKIFFSIEYRTK